jgi:hypothetical protein
VEIAQYNGPLFFQNPQLADDAIGYLNLHQPDKNKDCTRWKKRIGFFEGEEKDKLPQK